MGFRPVLRPSDASEDAATERACGACSLCCTVLRVDELAKPGGGAGFPLRGFLRLGEQNREVPLP